MYIYIYIYIYIYSDKYLVFAFTLEGAVMYIYYKICFYFAKNKFCCCYSYNSVRLLESPGILLKLLEKSWDFDGKSPGECEKSP